MNIHHNGEPEQNARKPRIVAIGGIGGSGTRLGAALLQILGYYIGEDLNDALDNLWFTLLFKRRSILTEMTVDRYKLISLFYLRMGLRLNFSDEQRAQVFDLAAEERPGYPKDWLLERAESFLDNTLSNKIGQPWGWKEPNTHILIDHCLILYRELHYIHFRRHPIDMALSTNQNQLRLWGPVILGRDVADEPRNSLAYWCAVDRRMNAIMQRWPKRVMIVDYEEFCAEPEQECLKVADFLNAPIPVDFRARCCDLIDPARRLSGRFKTADLTQFSPVDVSYVRELGYGL